jgi:hypothetical protein
MYARIKSKQNKPTPPAPTAEHVREANEDAARITTVEQLTEFICRLRKRHNFTPDVLRAFGLCERFLAALDRTQGEVERNEQIAKVALFERNALRAENAELRTQNASRALPSDLEQTIVAQADRIVELEDACRNHAPICKGCKVFAAAERKTLTERAEAAEARVRELDAERYRVLGEVGKAIARLREKKDTAEARVKVRGDALRLYMALCGNACANATRESAKLAYDTAEAALRGEEE